MLTLNRKEGESIILTFNEQRIKIVLSEAKHGQAKLSFDAPKEVLILREELELVVRSLSANMYDKY